MSSQSTTMPFPARLKTSLQFDTVMLTLVSLLLLGGFVILADRVIYAIKKPPVGTGGFLEYPVKPSAGARKVERGWYPHS